MFLVTNLLHMPLSLPLSPGADIFRLNFSHGEHQQKADLVKIIRAVEKKYDHPIAILADLQVSNFCNDSNMKYLTFFLLLLQRLSH